MYAYKISERRSCKALGFTRSVCRYRLKKYESTYLIKRIREIASIRVRYRYRRIHTLLQREGWKINHKRVYRLYRAEELQMRRKKPRRNVSAKPREEPVKAQRKNECWSMDFMTDELSNGRRIRILTIVDNFTRENLNVTPRFS